MAPKLTPPRVTHLGNLFDRLAEVCPQPPAPSPLLAWYWGDSLRCRRCNVRAENAGQLEACPSCGFSSAEPPPAFVCDVCGGTIDPAGWVILNGRTCHVVSCFGEALKQLPDPRKDFAIQLSATMPPEVAWRAGQQHLGAILSARRKAKKRG